MANRRTLAIVEASLAVVFWGASFIATKIALREVSPETVVWLRFLMGTLILGAAMFVRREAALPTSRELAYFAVLGFIGITFHQWLQSTGLVTAQASTTAWIVATTPIFIALLSWIFLKERLGLWGVLGITLATFGVLLVVSEGDLFSLRLGKFGSPGDILILISAVNWAVFSILSRRGLQIHPAMRMIFYVMGFGWLFSSLLFFANAGLSEISDLSRTGWFSVGFLGIFCSGFAYYFWYDALHVLPTAQVGSFLYVEPIVTVIIAAIILGEPLLLASLIGGAVILFGVWLVNRSGGSSVSPNQEDQPTNA
jgi:drug/metabolite transporter (DMT)-like permease